MCVLLAAGPARAGTTDLVAAPGVAAVATPGQSWLLGAEMSWGVKHKFFAGPRSRSLLARDLLVGEQLGLTLHTRFLAGRTAPDHRGALLLVGLEPRLSFFRDSSSDIVIYRMASPLGALLPEPGLALDGRRPRPYLAWALPFSFYRYDEFVPSLIWMSPLSRPVLLFAFSMRLL
jgi:hypothetical protein